MKYACNNTAELGDIVSTTGTDGRSYYHEVVELRQQCHTEDEQECHAMTRAVNQPAHQMQESLPECFTLVCRKPARNALYHLLDYLS